MKAILEFNLPDDEEEWRIYNQSQDLLLALARVREDLFQVFNSPNDFPMDEKTDAELRKIYESIEAVSCL